jgi:hypothetical protein
VRFGLHSFFCLTPADRAVICQWFTDHGVDPCDVDGLRLEDEGLPIAECVGQFSLLDGPQRFEVVIDARTLPPADVMFRWFDAEREMAR